MGRHCLCALIKTAFATMQRQSAQPGYCTAAKFFSDAAFVCCFFQRNILLESKIRASKMRLVQRISWPRSERYSERRGRRAIKFSRRAGQIGFSIAQMQAVKFTAKVGHGHLAGTFCLQPMPARQRHAYPCRLTAPGKNGVPGMNGNGVRQSRTSPTEMIIIRPVRARSMTSAATPRRPDVAGNSAATVWFAAPPPCQRTARRMACKTAPASFGFWSAGLARVARTISGALAQIALPGNSRRHETASDQHKEVGGHLVSFDRHWLASGYGLCYDNFNSVGVSARAEKRKQTHRT